eukprot:TRINITY_DN4983_c0_g2_i1.p1 TRINITY_DN4983_c0_g2~~TRINITY_DN4983_c0_g2_i1.p1  ORF type:complete len:225 (-),score=31.36 TRINITY_DN4983_c0_g2_i1:243-917(-)
MTQFARSNSKSGFEEIIDEGLISTVRFWSYLEQHPQDIQQIVQLLSQRWLEGRQGVRNHKRLDFIYKANSYFEFVHGVGLDVPKNLMERAENLQEEYLDNFRHSKPDFDRVKEVFMILREMGMKVIAGFKCPGLPHLLDLSIIHKNRRIAVFVNGPRRYTVNKPYKKMKDLPLFQRMVQSYGWEVVDVPFFEWIELSQVVQRRMYLEQKLQLIDQQQQLQAIAA